MAQLHQLCADGETRAGGFLVVFPSGHRKTITWVRNAPVSDTLAAAKAATAQLLQSLLDDGKTDDANRTNWASMTAAVQRIVATWSEKRRAALYAEPPAALSAPESPPSGTVSSESPSVGRH